MRFVLPHSREQRPAWMVRLGLFLYDHLGGRKRLPSTRRLDLRRDPKGLPIRDEYRTAFEYSDCWVDDARLVALNAVDARERGADIRTRTRCVSARRAGEGWLAELHDRASGETAASVPGSSRAVTSCCRAYTMRNTLTSCKTTTGA
jgi:D-erythritol 1-phosphate dehydrogenase